MYPHIFAALNPDPGSQNVLDTTDLDPDPGSLIVVDPTDPDLDAGSQNFVDPIDLGFDPVSQNVSDSTDPDPKHWCLNIFDYIFLLLRSLLKLLLVWLDKIKHCLVKFQPKFL